MLLKSCDMLALELYTDNQSLQTPQLCKHYLLRGTVSALKQLVCALLQGASRETLHISYFSGTFDT